ncbi:VOC family protein [Kribbella sp. GL6]|uniref:VOC family protein n=1 Tax=Kribbella sp. GL6 TaxID=3419765 RepID=UPI003D075DA3
MLNPAVEPRLDHLVFGTPDLRETVEEFAAATGIRPVDGGRHVELGTRNQLVALGPASYLEIVGPDVENPRPLGSAPFGVDRLVRPRLVTWCVRPAAIEEAVWAARPAGVDFGAVRTVGRVTPAGTALSWQVAAVDPPPYDGIVPFLIDWGTTRHPATTGAPTVELLSFQATHPKPADVATVMDALGISLIVTTGPSGLEATVAGPAGTYLLR